MEAEGSSAADQERADADEQTSKDAQTGEPNSKEEEELNTRYLRTCGRFSEFQEKS